MLVHVDSRARVPIMNWASDLTEGALDQAVNLAALPFVYHHVALMPDAHVGYGMPIGGVLATFGSVIVPNAVGVDIGCGVYAVQTDVPELTGEQLKSVMGGIRQRIPVGHAHHQTPQYMSMLSSWPEPSDARAYPVTHCLYEDAAKQVGTLGGGNHFIELQQGPTSVWITIHSGSRNIGYKVANYYNGVAKQMNSRWYTQVPREADVAFLPLDDESGLNYLTEMNLCCHFAKKNRQVMMARCLGALHYIMGTKPDILMEVHTAHNYAQMENHYGENVMVHRKGAVRSQLDEQVVIPGSMGTKTYIASGLGCVESFQSCSHGAGRQMGRKEATVKLDLEAEISRMDALGIVHGLRTKADLDEAPGAYKDIDAVMAAQAELVTPQIALRPLGVIKG